jgi:Flp pilus assembly protein TadD
MCTGARALPPGSPEAQESFALCQLADARPDEDRVQLLTRGQALAELALRADDHDGLAQLSLFCNLARRIQTSGPSLLRPFEMLRALQALDRAVALAPADPDVLTAKGALLVQLPRLLGGDLERGEQWLRRALAVDPHHDVARSYLDDTLARRAATSASTQ